jgi:3-methylcrotonyl-CoA carboxylase alpha subunit
VSEQPRAQPPPVTALGSNRYTVDDGERHRIAYAIQVGQATWVFLDGHVYVIHPDAASGVSRSSQRDDEALAAPMPATVITIPVVVGQRVTRGDVLVRLEAMKMELSITAPRDAVIVAIKCQPGEVVQPGAALVELG